MARRCRGAAVNTKSGRTLVGKRLRRRLMSGSSSLDTINVAPLETPYFQMGRSMLMAMTARKEARCLDLISYGSTTHQFMK